MFLGMHWFEWIATGGILAALFFVVATIVALYRAPDALTRANLMGPTIGIAIPLLLISLFIVDTGRDGFSLGSFIRVLLSCFGVWIIASVGSFYMGRSLYGVAVTDVKHARRKAAAGEAENDNSSSPTARATLNAAETDESRLDEPLLDEPRK